MQGAAQTLDSKGKEFWVTFMANLGSLGAGETSDMRLYLSADRPTTVRITYTLSADTRVVALPVANRPIEVDINSMYGDFVELDDVFSTLNEITPKSFHIVADNEITLYGVNIRSKSADAFLGLPQDVLTGRYIVLAYPNGFSGNQFAGRYDTPSQFAIIATEDATSVRITPPSGITVNGRPSETYTVTLNRGDVYFGQADIYETREQDVSGTEITATKPVAVFAGNKRTSIPTRVGNYRDHLVEQLPPLDAWGKGALLTPHFSVTPSSRDTAVARVLAAFPGTDVRVIGMNDITGLEDTSRFVLGPGISIELPLTGAMSISATQPIMVAQYEHSVNVDSSGFDIGDPFMMLIPPAEQFDTAYAFQSIIHREFINHHYINVVVPANATGSLRLDNSSQAGASFSPIPGSHYVYAQIKVPPGSHYIRCDSAFGLYVYGFGSANSYGYPGGMLFKTLVQDFQPPEVMTELWCDSLRGFFFDTRITDTGIDSCYGTSDTDNIVLSIPPFQRGADTVSYSARLLDPYQDGVVSVRAIDSGGRAREQLNTIPGFTVGIAGVSTVPAVIDTVVVLNTKKFCREVQLRNYGRFPQRVSRAWFGDSIPGGSIDPAQFPVTISPGQIATFNVCFENLPDSVFLASIDIAGDCIDRRVLLLPIDNRIDTSAPSIGIEGSPCSDEFILTFYERVRSAGIAAVDFDTTINCVAERLTDPNNLPADLVKVKLKRIDPRFDMIYEVTLRDVVGNSIVDSDTIGGFTLAMLDERGDSLGVRFDRSWEGDSIDLKERICDSVTITNYGSQPVHVERIVMRGNMSYSIPPSQLQFVVGPRRTQRIAICVEGRGLGDQLDTMLIYDACGHEDQLLMKTPVLAGLGTGRDRCNNALSISTFMPTKRTFLTAPMPNPANSAAEIDLGLARPEIVDLEIFSSTGQPVMSVLRNIDFPSGVSRVAFDVSSLESGAYFCRMTTLSGVVYVEKMVVSK